MFLMFLRKKSFYIICLFACFFYFFICEIYRSNRLRGRYMSPCMDNTRSPTFIEANKQEYILREWDFFSRFG